MTQETAIATAEEIAAFRERVLRKLTYSVGKDPENASDYDWFHAVALATRDSTIDRWMDCTREAYTSGQKRVYYLSLEFLIGRLLVDSLSNLGLFDVAREALAGLDVDIERIRLLEPDAALGNGGLGRLAACFMESMATLGVVSHGYGIRYDHGLFRQAIVDGWQHEQTETWLDFGNPWEFERSEVKYLIGFGGSVTAATNEKGEVQHFWHWAEGVRAIAYDTPIVGWRGAGVNTLRLWRARPEADFHLARFNAGDHIGAAAEEARAESISRVLYPADSTEAGQELRLRQEYFFVAASLQDLLRRHIKQRGSLDSLPDYTAIQLNDTHPAIAVAELMRLLVDVHSYEWQHAWRLTTATLSYTNHTLLPEALETWPVGLMERLLPRHMQIIYLINAYHLDQLRERGVHDAELLRSVSLIEEDHGRRVRMGNLAFLGSHSTNGVSGLHTQLMRKTVFTDLHSLYPQRINSKTNGITFRRWLYQANPQLTQLLVEHVGEEVLDEPETRLRELEPFAEQAAFRQRFAEQRLANKRHPGGNWVPRVKIFAGKAAASYHQAKLIIKLTNDIANTINADPTVRGLLKVVFLPNYNVSLAEDIIPAADLSEQISTAGLEASGTSNMKFALNGALTIGTLDGANVEMSEQIGLEHMFIFGLTAQQVNVRKQANEYNAEAIIGASPRLSEVLSAIRGGAFSPGDPGRYTGLVDGISWHDTFMVCADFEAYWQAQLDVEECWRDPARWWRSSVLNTARTGWFSSDRTIREYAREIWKVL